MRAAVVIDNKRTITLDAGFGLRQLADIALRALSPSLNDPTTAVTCVGYLRTLLVQLAGRGLPSAVRFLPKRSLTIIAERREFGEFLESLEEVARNAQDEPRVQQAIEAALGAVMDAATTCDASGGRAAAVAAVQAKVLATAVGHSSTES